MMIPLYYMNPYVYRRYFLQTNVHGTYSWSVCTIWKWYTGVCRDDDRVMWSRVWMWEYDWEKNKNLELTDEHTAYALLDLRTGRSEVVNSKSNKSNIYRSNCRNPNDFFNRGIVKQEYVTCSVVSRLGRIGQQLTWYSKDITNQHLATFHRQVRILYRKMICVRRTRRHAQSQRRKRSDENINRVLSRQDAARRYLVLDEDVL